MDGKLYGISTGSNAFAVLVNPTLFKQAGVPLPDDRTGDDYAKIGEGLSHGPQEVDAGDVSDPPALQPIGASDLQNSITRYLTGVRFARMTPADAAAKMTDEIKGMITT